MAKKLKTVKLKGKDYVLVNERLMYFRENYPEHALTTEILSVDADSICMKATVFDGEGRIVSTGHAQEDRESSYVNKTSYIENCETSAVGRALGNFGIGISSSVSSYDEAQRAIAVQEELKKVEMPTAEDFDAAMNAAAEIAKITELLDFTGTDVNKVLALYKVKALDDLTPKQREALIKSLEKRKGEAS